MYPVKIVIDLTCKCVDGPVIVNIYIAVNHTLKLKYFFPSRIYIVKDFTISSELFTCGFYRETGEQLLISKV